MTATYPAKKSPIWIVFFFGFAAFFAYIAITVSSEKASPSMILFAQIFFGFFSLLMTALGISPWFTYTTIDDEQVVSVWGPIRITIPLEKISKVRSYPLFNTVRIYTSALGGAKIYPYDRKGFLQDLASRIPDIEVPIK